MLIDHSPIIIQVKHLPATERKGRRVRAKMLRDDIPCSATISYVWRMEDFQNELRAIDRLCNTQGYGPEWELKLARSCQSGVAMYILSKEH